jgi:RHS repeat-associated protein
MRRSARSAADTTSVSSVSLTTNAQINAAASSLGSPTTSIGQSSTATTWPSPSASANQAASEATSTSLDSAGSLTTCSVNLGFDSGLADWNIQEFGGSAAGRGTVTVGSAVLHEGDSFLVSIDRRFTIPSPSNRLQFAYEASFDLSSTNQVRDAFEVGLFDGEGQSLVYTLRTEGDAFFNDSEGLGPVGGQGVTVVREGSLERVTVDLSSVSAGQQATLVFRLVNNDADTASIVHITSADLVGGPDGYRWHNTRNPLDTNDDGRVSPIDALIVINALNVGGTVRLPDLLGETSPPPYYDVNSDAYVSPRDALMVINYLNLNVHGEGEGEAAASQDESDNGDMTGVNATTAALNPPAEGLDDAPWITLRGLSEGTSLPAGTSFVVEGQLHLLSADQAVYVTVNGVPVGAQDANGRFFSRQTLALGDNAFDVCATTPGGEVVATASLSLAGAGPAAQSDALDSLADVTASVRASYGRTYWNQGAHRLYTELAWTNEGTYDVDNPLTIVVSDISDAAIQPSAPDGVTHDGRAYYDFSESVSDDLLAPGESSDQLAIAFIDPDSARFTYDFEVLGHLNSAPVVTSVPIVQATLGQPYRYRVSSFDAEGNARNYALVAGPSDMALDAFTGELTWRPDSADAGSHDVILRATDSRGAYTTQAFTITAAESPPNRPPVITSTPVTDAAVVTSFEVRDVVVGRDPVAAALGDFTNSGTLSIVTAHPVDQAISLAAANGNFSYDPAISTSVGEPVYLYRTFRDGYNLPVAFPYPIRSSSIYGLGKGDFDGDGVIDLAGTAQYALADVGTVGAILVWRGNGDGTFTEPMYTELPRYPHILPYGILIRDFDRDGRLDLVVNCGTSTENSLRLLRGNGDGSFQAPAVVASNVVGSIVQTADLNGDDILDLVTGGGNHVAVYLGDGTGGFAAGDLYGVGSGVTDLAIGDLDGNGHLDLAIGLYQDAQIDVLLGDGTGLFGGKMSIKAGPNVGAFQVTGLTAADFNGNGRAELAVSSTYGHLNFVEWQTNGSFKFLTDDNTYGRVFLCTFPARGAASDNASQDVNRDGRPDFVFVASDGGLNIASVGVNKGDGTFEITRYIASAGSGVPGFERSYSIPTGVVVGDFNNDGVADLANTSGADRYAYRPGGVTIHLGTTPGALDAPTVSSLTGDSHRVNGVVVGDFTGDDLPDAVIPGAETVVLPNAGDGTFGAPFLGHGSISGSGEYFTNYVRVADFNADGQLDIVYLGTDGVQAGPRPRYIVAFGYGNGTFQPAVFYSPQSSDCGASNVTVADFNQDGLPDIAGWYSSGNWYTSGQPITIEIWLNDPDNPGHFQMQYNGPSDALVSVGPQPPYPAKGFTAADFTGDGIPDLITHTVQIDPNTPERQSVFPGRGDGTFGDPFTSAPGYGQAQELVAADLNGDGRQDVVATVNGAGTYVQIGNGDGTFEPAVYYRDANGESVTVRDVDGDGALDIVTIPAAYWGNVDLAVLIGRGDGTFWPAEQYAVATTGNSDSVNAADLNADGRTDLVYFDSTLQSVVTMYGNGPGLAGVATADVNRDGRLDVVAINTGNDRVKLLLGNGDNTFTRAYDLITGTSPVAMSVGDLTGDGNPEIVTANRVGTATVFINQANGTFARTDLTAGRRPSAVALGDVTGDGKPDIVISNEDGASVTLFASQDSSLFAAGVEMPVGIRPSDVSIADVTGDGVMDLVVGSAWDRSFVVLAGDGDGKFVAQVAVPVQASFGALAVGDVTGDGRADIVVAKPDEQQVSLYVGFGSGRFSTPQPIAIDPSPIALTVVDLNADGIADIVTTNHDSDTATVITSRPTESQPYMYRVTAADADGDSVTFALADGPAGMTIDTSTGVVAWSPTSSQLGRHAVTLSASDENGGSTTQTFIVTVDPAHGEHAPRIVTEPIDVALSTVPYEYHLRAADRDEDPLRYQLESGPDGMTISPDFGTLTWGASLGRGLHFNGRGDIATIPGPSTLDPVSGFTIALWAKLDVLPATTREGMTLAHLATANGQSLQLVATTDNRFQIRINGWSHGATTLMIETAKWYHLVMTYDPIAGYFSLGVNGATLIDSGIGVSLGSRPSGMASLLLGNDSSDGQSATFFAGVIDEVRAYNRALTEIEAIGEYRGDRAANPPGLGGWWDFNEWDGTTLRDRSGNSNDGTLDDPSAAARMRVALPDRPQGPGITGDFSVTVRVEDGRCGFDEQAFTLHVTADEPASVSGTLFNDLNADSTPQADESGLAGWNLFVDRNQNGLADAGEETTTTAADGVYAFGGLTPGIYALCVLGRTGWRTTFADNLITLASGQHLADIDLGVTTVAVDVTQRAPTFVSSPPATAAAGGLFRYQPAVSNLDGRQLIFDLLVSPEGMAIDAVSGAIGWLPTDVQCGSQRVLVKVQDDRGLVSVQDFTLTVAGAPSAPIITSVPPDAAIVGVTYYYQAFAQDADGGPFEFSLAAAPANMSVDPATGLISWTPDASQLGVAAVMLHVTDSSGLMAEQTFVLTVTSAATDHVPNITSISRTTASLAYPYYCRVQASDPDADRLTFALSVAPAGMSIHAATGMVKWTPASDQLGPSTVTVTVADGRGGVDTQTFVITVTSQMTNQTPRFTSTPPHAIAGDALFAYSAQVFDPDGDAVEFLLDESPSGMSIDPESGAVRWQLASSVRGDFPVTIRALDSLGGEAVQSFVLSVWAAGAPPAITSIPLTLARTERDYVYAVVASDGLSRALQYSLTECPAEMAIDTRTGVIRWTPQQAQLGPHTVTIRVDNGHDGVATQSFDLVVTDGASVLAPIITSTPPETASAGASFAYEVTAIDPGGLALRFELYAGPAGMSLDAKTGLLMWTADQGDIGTTRVAVAVINAAGISASQQFLLTVLPANHAATLTSSPVVGQAAGGLYRYDVIAVDPDHDVLQYRLLAGPAGMMIDAFGRVQWRTTTADLGTHAVKIAISDGRGGDLLQSYDLTVSPDTAAPRVVVLPNRMSIWPWDGAIRVRVSAVDNVGVTDVTLTANGQPLPLDALGNAVLTYTSPGLVKLAATACDAAGNIGIGRSTVRFLDPLADNGSTIGAPTVAITSPVDGDSVSGFVDVIGTAQSDDLSEYRLLYRRADQSIFQEITRSSINVSDGVLGRWDATLLENDSYVLRLEATDNFGNVAVTQCTLGLSGAMKLGNFQLAFTDLSIPVSGIPLTITRTYDTMRADRQGEFGYGWSLDYRDTDLRTSVPKSGLENLGLYTPLRPGTKVYVTLPGGTRQGYTFTPEMHGLLSLVYYTPHFTPDPGVTTQLTVSYVALTLQPDGAFYTLAGEPYHPASEDFGSGYTLTTKEGIVYRIDGTSGLMLSATDRNNNRLTFTANGISSSTGDQITLTRTPSGQITKITDIAGKSITYAYDSSRNLVSMTDRTGNTTSFAYRADRPHYLDSVVDPLGRVGTRANYDATGRLIGIVDAAGHAVEFAYDPAHSLETIADQLGNPTTYEYDARGNVVTQVDALGGITSRTYDAADNLLTETDPLGHTTSYSYDEAGNKTTETDPLGYVTRLVYDQWNDVVAKVDPLGHVVTNAYDAYGNLLSTTSAEGRTTTFTYNSGGEVATVTDGLGYSTTYQHDSAGNVVKQIDAEGNLVTTTYDANHNRLTQTITLTSASGSWQLVTQTQHDAEGRIVKVIDALGGTTETRYDANGDRVAEIDALGHATTYAYDERHNLVAIAYPDGTHGTTVYDAAGHIATTIDESGRRTDYTYDALGHRTDTSYPDGTHTQTQYDAAGHVTAQFDEHGNRTSYAYDAAGHQIEVLSAEGSSLQREYDAAGRQTGFVDALAHRTQYTYNADGQLLITQFADGTTASNSYDDRGQLRVQTDQAGQTMSYEYDGNHRLTAVIDALGGRTLYTYDERGEPVAQTDANGHTIRYEYDGLGRRIATILPLGQRSTNVYDAVGSLVQATSYNGDQTTYTYDARHRLLSTLYADGTGLVYAYTPTGHISSVTDARGTTTYVYDTRDRLLTRTDPDGRQISYAYDATGNITAITTASGTVQYAFDSVNRMVAVVDADGQSTHYVYDDAGNLLFTDFPNQTRETRQYDAVSQLVFVGTTGPTGVVNAFTYVLDAVGNRLRETDNAGRQVNYVYDAARRLIAENITDPTTGNHHIAYTYDPVGNRLACDDSLEGLAVYDYDANDRLVIEELAGDVTRYAYDNDGNMVAKIHNNVDQVFYQWDQEDRLIAVDTDGDGVNDIVNAYDASGNRVMQRVDGQETRFLIDTNGKVAQVVEEYAPAGVVKVSYTLGQRLISQKQSGTRSYFHVDALGSTRALTNAAGVVSDRYTYEAFGRLLSQSGSTSNLYLFGGEQWDPSVGSVYLRARYYDPTVGRFTSADPLAGELETPITLHSYLYAGANPVSFTDPSGTVTLPEVLYYVNFTVAAFVTGLSILNLPATIRVGVGLFTSGVNPLTLKELKGDPQAQREALEIVTSFYDWYNETLPQLQSLSTLGCMRTNNGQRTMACGSHATSLARYIFDHANAKGVKFRDFRLKAYNQGLVTHSFLVANYAAKDVWINLDSWLYDDYAPIIPVVLGPFTWDATEDMVPDKNQPYQ